MTEGVFIKFTIAAFVVNFISWTGYLIYVGRF